MTKARDIASAIPAPSTVDATELGYLDGVTSAIQTQIDTKAPSSTAVTLTGTQTLTNKTLTNPVIASVVNNTLTSTTGDMIYASSANTPARLGIGSSAQVLTVASGVPSWATPAAGGGMTLLSTTTLSGSTTTISSISQDYKHLHAIIRNFIPSVDGYNPALRFNGVTTATYNVFAASTAAASMRDLGFDATMMEISQIGQDNGTTNYLGILDIYDYTNTTTWKWLAYREMVNRYTNASRFSFGSSYAFHNNTAAISSLTFLINSGTFSGGTVYLYGVK